MYRCYTSGELCHVPSLGNLGSVEVFLPMFLHVLSLLNVTLIDFNRVISWWFLELVYIENCHRSFFNFHELSNVYLKDVLWSVDPFMDSSWVSVEFRLPATPNVKICHPRTSWWIPSSGAILKKSCSRTPKTTGRFTSQYLLKHTNIDILIIYTLALRSILWFP